MSKTSNCSLTWTIKETHRCLHFLKNTNKNLETFRQYSHHNNHDLWVNLSDKVGLFFTSTCLENKVLMTSFDLREHYHRRAERLDLIFFNTSKSIWLMQKQKYFYSVLHHANSIYCALWLIISHCISLKLELCTHRQFGVALTGAEPVNLSPQDSWASGRHTQGKSSSLRGDG